MLGKCSTFDARPPVPLSDGLDTRPCKILDPPLAYTVLVAANESEQIYKAQELASESTTAIVAVIITKVWLAMTFYATMV